MRKEMCLKKTLNSRKF